MSVSNNLLLFTCRLLLVCMPSIALAQNKLISYRESRPGINTSSGSLEGVRDGKNREFYSTSDPVPQAMARIFRNGIEETMSVRMTGRRFLFESGIAPQPGDDLRVIWSTHNVQRQESLVATDVVTPEVTSCTNDRSVAHQLLRQLFESEASDAAHALPTPRRISSRSDSRGEISSLRMLDETLRSNAEKQAHLKRSQKNNRGDSSLGPDSLADYEFPTIFSELDDSDPLIRVATRSSRSTTSSPDRSVGANPISESLRMLARTLRENARRESHSQ